MHQDTFCTRGGKKLYEMQPQQQSGNHPGSPLASTRFLQAKNIFGTRAPRVWASLPFLARPCMGVIPCTPIHVLRKLCLPVIRSFLLMLKPGRWEAHSRQVGRCLGPGLLRNSRPRLLLYFRNRRTKSPDHPTHPPPVSVPAPVKVLLGMC